MGQEQLLLVFIITTLFVRRVLVAEEFICYDVTDISSHVEEKSPN